MPKWTEEQQLAIDKTGTNIIVSAGAGSGKTAVLSERVIRILKGNIHVNELLILTFTKKAAFEMKERIRKKISKDESLKNELALLDSSYITTFDSFALSVVKKYNYLLNVSKSISIIDDSILFIEKNRIIDDIFEKLYEEKNTNFLKLIDSFTIKNDNDIKKYIIEINNKLDLKYDKEEYLDNYLNNYYDNKNVTELFNSYQNLALVKIKQLDSLVTELSEYLDVTYMDKLYEALSGLLSSKTYDEVRTNVSVKLPMLPRNSEEPAKNIKEKISEIIKELDNLSSDSKKEMIDNYLSTEDYLKILIVILKEFNKRINEYKFSNSKYEFADISKMAIKIVKENPEIRNEMKNYFKEIMIDEYQDTSDLQEMFISMIENNNVYMVGDIKQSIYRFRNANPYLFKEKYDNYSKNKNGFKIDLTKNFRSRKEVINNINLIFNDLMTDPLGGASYRESHNMVYGNTSYDVTSTNQDYDMEILDYEYDKDTIYSKKEIEIFTIATDILNKVKNKYQIFDKDEQIVRDCTYSDFVILLDRSTNFDLFKKIFEYLGIPLNKYTTTSLMETEEIFLIKNILKILISLKNENYDVDFRYSLVSILRSYLFSYKDDEIFNIMETHLLDNEPINILKELSKELEFISLGEIIKEIVDKFDFYNKTILVGDVSSRIRRIDEIMDIFNSLAESNYDIEKAYEYITELIENDYDIQIDEKETRNNSVQIMTIHASKGLEFHVCYFAFLDAKFNISELNERFLYSDKYGIVTPYYNKGIGTVFVKNLIKEDYLLEEISEKIRLFYVALTRSKEKIIMITSLNDRKEKELEEAKSFIDFITYLKEIINPYIKKIKLDNINLTKDYNLIKKSNYKESINKTNEKIEFRKVDVKKDVDSKQKISKTIKTLSNKELEDKLKFGTKIHNIFENIDFYSPDYDSLNIDDFYVAKIKQFIDSISLDKVVNIYKEYEFIYNDGGIEKRGIIDLMLEYKDKIEIIDYKLKNIEDEEYSKQVNEYKKYIMTKTNKTIETYLYSITTGKKEIVK